MFVVHFCLKNHVAAYICVYTLSAFAKLSQEISGTNTLVDLSRPAF